MLYTIAILAHACPYIGSVPRGVSRQFDGFSDFKKEKNSNCRILCEIVGSNNLNFLVLCM